MLIMVYVLAAAQVPFEPFGRVRAGAPAFSRGKPDVQSGGNVNAIELGLSAPAILADRR
jgi:hypothetical protein